jgi:hypothetical protein
VQKHSSISASVSRSREEHGWQRTRLLNVLGITSPKPWTSIIRQTHRVWNICGYTFDILLITIISYLAPTRSAIQQELTLEESDESTIHGQTSWIACGIKIQEIQ